MSAWYDAHTSRFLSVAAYAQSSSLRPSAHTPSTGPDFLDELASSLVNLVGTALFPLWWEARLRPGVFLSKDNVFWFLHRKFPKLHFLPLFCFSDQFTGQDVALKPVLALSVLNLEKIQKESENSQTFRTIIRKEEDSICSLWPDDSVSVRVRLILQSFRL